MEQIRKDLVLAAVVRTFFKYFTVGIIETQSDNSTADRFEPSNIKRTMLEHYEEIGQAFNTEAFYAIFRMNYEENEIEETVRRNVASGATLMDLVRLACRTDELYEAMVNEYKYNFELLLCGRIAAQDDQIHTIMHCPSAGRMPRQLAESIINRIATAAYERGCSIATSHNGNVSTSRDVTH